MQHQTYIIYSSSRDRYYIGSTSVGSDLRTQRHNAGWTQTTRGGGPWVLKYCKSFKHLREARRWERFIKKQKSRAFIERLIASDENEVEE